MITTAIPSNAHLPPHRHSDFVVGAKKALKPREVWSIRARLQMTGATRDLALFNLAMDSKLRSCDPVTLRVSDVAALPKIRDRAIVVQHKTGRPVQFEITHQTRDSLRDWFASRNLRSNDYVFPSRNRPGAHLSTRQYVRILKQWVAGIGLDPADYGSANSARAHKDREYRQILGYRCRRRAGDRRAFRTLIVPSLPHGRRTDG